MGPAVSTAPLPPQRTAVDGHLIGTDGSMGPAVRPLRGGEENSHSAVTAASFSDHHWSLGLHLCLGTWPSHSTSQAHRLLLAQPFGAFTPQGSLSSPAVCVSCLPSTQPSFHKGALASPRLNKLPVPPALCGPGPPYRGLRSKTSLAVKASATHQHPSLPAQLSTPVHTRLTVFQLPGFLQHTSYHS